MENPPTKRMLQKIPKLYSQENVKDPKVRMKFFLQNMTWYVIEFDGQDTFFGWVINDDFPQGAELGYISFRELKSLRGRFGGVEREIHGITVDSPMKLSEVKRRHNINHGNTQTGVDEFYKDSDGKISNTRVSPYGMRQLQTLQGAILHFTDGTAIVKGDKLIIRTGNGVGKVIEILNSDRKINKVIFKVM